MQLQASLDIIRKTSTELINAIETNFKELSEERGVNAEIMAVEAEMQEQEKTEIIPEFKSETVLMPLLYDDGSLTIQASELMYKQSRRSGTMRYIRV
jgi:hypothetical protein